MTKLLRLRQKKTLTIRIDRDKTKNKHYEQTLFLKFRQTELISQKKEAF